MKREDQSDFLDSLTVSKRGIVKTAASQVPNGRVEVLSQEDVTKALRAFDKCPDVSKDVLNKFKERAKIDLSPKTVVEDFFQEFCASRRELQQLSIITALTLRQNGIFKFSGRDVYEDLETGDFWKISDDKKHVMRLFKEDESGISDKKAAAKEQSIADGTKCKFSFDGEVSEFLDESTRGAVSKNGKDASDSEIKALEGKICTVVNLATYAELGEKDHEYYNIEFPNGVEIEACSGYHLTPITQSKASVEAVQAGKKKGPGVPDGTGPMKDSPECPYNKDDEEDFDKESDILSSAEVPKGFTGWRNYDLGGSGVVMSIRSTKDEQGFEIKMVGSFRSGDSLEDTVKQIKDFWEKLDIDS